MEMELQIKSADVMTSLILALLSDLTSQAALERQVDASQCPRQCHSHGECVATGNGVLACHCHKGWGGNACSLQCTKSCLNGECTFLGSKQTCECTKGFHGDQCQHPNYSVISLLHITRLLTDKWDKAMPMVKDPRKVIEQNIAVGSNICSDNFQCQNGGKCRPGSFGGYRCDCDTSAHTGTFCQHTCPHRCLNGGKCLRLRKPGKNTDGNVTLLESEVQYSCVCVGGFSGHRCQVENSI